MDTGAFHLSAVVNTAAMNMMNDYLVQVLLSILFGMPPRIEMDHMVIGFLFEELQNFSIGMESFHTTNSA